MTRADYQALGVMMKKIRKDGVRIPLPCEIEAARSAAGGWTRAQLAQWGVPWPPPKGWRRVLEKASGVQGADEFDRLEREAQGFLN